MQQSLYLLYKRY